MVLTRSWKLVTKITWEYALPAYHHYFIVLPGTHSHIMCCNHVFPQWPDTFAHPSIILNLYHLTPFFFEYTPTQSRKLFPVFCFLCVCCKLFGDLTYAGGWRKKKVSSTLCKMVVGRHPKLESTADFDEPSNLCHFGKHLLNDDNDDDNSGGSDNNDRMLMY